MFLEKIKLQNYKNIENCETDFFRQINCFVGNNGVGKTNLLDAIYYLSFCKSNFNAVDAMNIRHGDDYFLIRGTYRIDDETKHTITCSYQRDGGKSIRKDNKAYVRFSDHIGRFPLVMITPSDSDLIYGGSELRRKYMDGVIAQFDKLYLDVLISYNKVLAQRNALLKQFSESGRFDGAVLEVFDSKLVELGAVVFEKRKAFLDGFIPMFQEYYTFITEGCEQVGLGYESQLSEAPFAALVAGTRNQDRAAQYTTTGIHKDDFLFTIGGYPIKKFGSQGQQKSFLVSLKLAQFDYTKKQKGFRPIVLFDDILDKLDYGRVEKLMKLVGGEHFGQIFITDTHTLRIANIFREINVDTRIFEVRSGEISILDSW